jgi:hypothetical protein
VKNWKLGLGGCFAVMGALGIVLEPVLGLTELGRPWTFLVGFSVGLMAGIGAALSVAGLAGLRRPPVSR